MLRTRNLQKTQIGEVVSIPMGAVLPHAIKVETMFSTICEPKGQLVVSGKAVEVKGHSKLWLGRTLQACVWLQI